jgi:hypothetical protein
VDAPSPQAPSRLGCDLAKHTDHTVLVAWTGGRVLAWKWRGQPSRLAHPEGADRRLLASPAGLLVLDATGLGDPVYDDLKTIIPDSSPYGSPPDQDALIQRLVVGVEQRQISWPKSWTVLTDEMKRYEYKISRAAPSSTAPRRATTTTA